MNNYNMQYKQYYERLQNKAIKQYTPMANRQDEILSPYGNFEKSKINKNKNFVSDLVNVFIYQMVIAIILFMTIFYFKYSGSEKYVAIYSLLKQAINNDTTILNDAGDNDFEGFIKDAKTYINELGGEATKIKIEY